eukprot:2374428-Alexandrium_andersonii.AAC.1
MPSSWALRTPRSWPAGCATCRFFEYTWWAQETTARCLAVVGHWRRGLPVGRYFGNVGGACRAPLAS